MNQYKKDRIEHIVAMLMYITGLPKDNALHYVKSTKVYKYILSGDELTIYESYPSNLSNMIDEWKKNDAIPLSLKSITAEHITTANSWLKKQSFRNAKQAIDFLSARSKKHIFCHWNPTMAHRPKK